MWQLLRYRHWRMAVAGTALVALLIAVMAVDPLRTAAAQFLSIFRVQQFTVVQVDPSQMEKLKDFDQKIFVDTQVDKTPPVDVSGAEEASKLAGFTVLTPSRVPPQTPNRTEFAVAKARTAQTQVDLASGAGPTPGRKPADRRRARGTERDRDQRIHSPPSDDRVQRGQGRVDHHRGAQPGGAGAGWS